MAPAIVRSGIVRSIMTRDERVGRVLVVALQQSIAEELPPGRAEFYDHWLGREGLRDGTLGMAQMAAVVGFLRTEGAGYQRVVERAGRLVAEWTWADVDGVRRRLMRMPRWWRSRAVCRRMVVVSAGTCPSTLTKASVSRGVVTLQVRGSVFCTAREAPASPLCAFYAALLVAMFASVDLVLAGQMDQCCAGADPDERGKACLGTFAVSSAS
jgi:hypothetical protein